MPKRVVILGSTGSIGCAALEVVAALAGDVSVVGLAARQGWQLLAEQAARFGVPYVAIADEQHSDDLTQACPPQTHILTGSDGLVELVRTCEADFVLAAIVGVAGLPATLAAIERGLDIGLANKESLVVAGPLIMPLARARGSTLIPVDSEHSAIFQALLSGRPEEVRRIYLTASGGPFRTWDRARMEQADLEQALQHPVWSMGPKITVDSATMMNKALEVIEAHYLFGVDVAQIRVLIHPEAVVHSMVEYCDGSLIAQLGTPDMKTPIQYAMTYPRRVPGIAELLDWSQACRLNFEPPDFERFPALRLGFEAARAGGSSPAVLNAANEATVQLFCDGAIPFGRIAALAEQVLSRHRRLENPTLAQLLECDAWARQEVTACMRHCSV
ncbi:MAG: 1-deoxy-D-xylulose-5-phosphate reductoisomerase [Planctomycetes bacterium]|nr:1-deoxy-D-xylulose-5-phosphate reductoisomerase [Planctomycetota bacterium]